MLAQELVDRARALAFLPNTTSFTDAAILSEINLAQRMMLVPALVRVMGEYFTEVADVVPDTNGFVRMPTGAAASTSRVISWVYADGHEGDPLGRADLADIGGLQSQGYSVGTPFKFTLVPDGIQVYGSDISGGSVRFRFSRLPSDLSLTDPTGYTVVSVTLDSGTGNYEAILEDVGSLAAPIDVTDGNAPYRMVVGGCTLYIGAVVLGPDPTVAARVPVGSYAFPAGTTPVPQYPKEWHDLLLYFSAARLAGLRKDFALKADLLSDAGNIQRELTNLSQPRTKQNPKVISAWRGHVQRPWRLA